MSKKQSKVLKEAVARTKLVFTEIEGYLDKPPFTARITMGDMAVDIANRFGLTDKDVYPLIRFYFHVSYDIGEHDYMLRRGRTGGIQKVRKTNGT